MKDHIRAFQVSLLIHIVIILFLVVISTHMVQREPVLVIDLSDSSPFFGHKQGFGGNISAINRIMKAPEQEDLIQQPMIHEEPARETIQTAEVRTEPQTSTLITANEPSAALVKPFGENELSPSDSSRNILNMGDGAGSARQTSENTSKALYLKKHFLYIRDIIQKNIIYPTFARKMGWQGKVTLSFLIMPDGCASEIKITKSSGKDILDRNALETVKRVSPFPPPPVKAEITVPVVYALQ